jgi:hypothetical protein
LANYRVSTNTNNNSNKTTQDKTTTTNERKMDRLNIFTLKHELLKISVHLQTEFAAETHPAEGQWLKEQLNVVKLSMFRVGTLMPTVSRTEGQHLAPLKTFIKNKASE